jgi:hypothetical protein
MMMGPQILSGHMFIWPPRLKRKVSRFLDFQSILFAALAGRENSVSIEQMVFLVLV